MQAITDEFEAYGWRRIQAALARQGHVASHKTIKRLMKEHGMNVRYRRRHVATTDSTHDKPIFPNPVRDREAAGPNRL